MKTFTAFDDEGVIWFLCKASDTLEPPNGAYEVPSEYQDGLVMGLKLAPSVRAAIENGSNS